MADRYFKKALPISSGGLWGKQPPRYRQGLLSEEYLNGAGNDDLAHGIDKIHPLVWAGLLSSLHCILAGTKDKIAQDADDD